MSEILLFYLFIKKKKKKKKKAMWRPWETEYNKIKPVSLQNTKYNNPSDTFCGFNETDIKDANTINSKETACADRRDRGR